MKCFYCSIIFLNKKISYKNSSYLIRTLSTRKIRQKKKKKKKIKIKIRNPTGKSGSGAKKP